MSAICAAWPDCPHTPRCARCLALDQCRAQIMILGPAKWHDSGYLTPGPITPKRSHQLLDRLLAWLRWPGVDNIAIWQEKWRAIGLDWTRSTVRDALLGSSGWNASMLLEHPLDAVENGAQLRALAFTCLACPGQCTPDWPAIAVICDLLTQHSLWADVHAYRAA